MSSDIVPRPSSTSPAVRWQQRQIDKSIALEAYRHTRSAELVDYKRSTIDWIVSARIKGDLHIAEDAVRAIQLCPAAAEMIADSLSDRRRLLSELFRDLR